MSLPLVAHADYVTPLPPGHRFPMPKFAMLRDLIVSDGVATQAQFHTPSPASREALLRVHEPAYLDAFINGALDSDAQRRIGLPWSPGLVRRTITAVGGTMLTAKLALTHGLACNTAGGTHHAFPHFGSGFCILNDLAVAARGVIDDGLADHVLIVDLDVHQGDGSAFIFRDDPAVTTFSMHCAKNFPARKQQSDIDIPLPVGTDDQAYLQSLADVLPALLEEIEPDLVLYDAGVDTHHRDRLGRLSMTSAGLAARDRFVIDCCRARHIPIACVIGGGYSEDLHELVRRHSIVHRQAAAAYARGAASADGVGQA